MPVPYVPTALTPRSLGGRVPAYPASPHWSEGRFRNALPSRMVQPEQQGSMAREFLSKGKVGRPSSPVPLVVPDLSAQAADLAATWLGHSTLLVEVDGARVLADPVFSERCSPSQSVGPRRLHPVPIDMDALPAIDAVVISHDHYDHLDTLSVRWLARYRDPVFVVPLGIGAHLLRWGVAPHRVVELDWEASTEVAGVQLTCTEARHFSGRGLVRDTTLWASWVVAGPEHRVFYGGDTGFTPAFAEIGSRHGPFDLVALPIGAYDHRWPDIHMDPAEAVRTREEMGGGLLLPVHWATFDLAFHPWAEPVERLLELTGGEAVTTPRPGERWELGGAVPLAPWWR